MKGLIRTNADYDYMIRRLATVHTVSIDTETTGLDPYVADEIRGISVGTDEDEWYLPISHDDLAFDPMPLMNALRRMRFVFHHGVFDYAFLDQIDDTVAWEDQTIWDTQVVNWLIDENLKVGLKESCERILGYDAGEEKRALKAIKGKTWATYSAEDIGQYAAKDARLTWDLWQWQQEHLKVLKPEIPLAEVEREVQVQRSLYRMIRTGVVVDPERVLEGRESFMEKIRSYEDYFAHHGVNPNAPAQVAKWIYGGDSPYTPTVTSKKTGKPSVAKGVLQDLADKGCRPAQVLLEYRRWTKAVTAYFDPLHRLIGEDGRVHPHFSSTRTVTGRFSCSNPNLQTIPRDDTMPEVRRCFRARPGFRLVSFDLKQAELRVIAGFAKEQAMIDALAEGRDLHSETAESIFGKDFTDLQRRLAKNLNFGFAYGIGPAKFATYMKPVPDAATIAEAKRILNGYKHTYPKVAALLSGAEKIAKRDGYVPGLIDGRYRRFRGPGYTNHTYTAVNFWVQGGIGEFMKDTMNAWYASGYDGAGAYLVLQIHDELVFEIADHIPVEHIQDRLQGIANDLDPFYMPMEWDVKEWKQ